MDFELWYLVLVPLLFAAGWLCRGIDLRQRADNGSAPGVYSKGVSLLLAGETDKAIDAFIEAVRLDPEQIELHHVLGDLFRRRGEFERAIRLHRSLYNRADLSKEERARALKELAEDYIKAGLFDRAEAAFRLLSDVPSEHLYALRRLLGIYVTEHEWASATETARLLETRAGESHAEEIAHFYCERIEGALRAKRLDEARLLVEQVDAYSSATPRVGFCAGAVRLAEGDAQGAADAWRRTVEAYPDYLPVIVGQFADALAKMGDRAGAVALLKDACDTSRTIDAMEAALSRIAAWEGAPAAEAIAVKMLQAHPSLSAFNALVQLKSKANPGDEQTKLLAGLLGRHARRFSRYQCSKCGFLASNFSWHCLGCGSWDSFPPRRIEDIKRRPRT